MGKNGLGRTLSGDVEYYGFYIFALPFLVFEIFNF